MPGKRKRRRPYDAAGNHKRPKVEQLALVQHDILRRYYTHIFTLREYIIDKLPIRSKNNGKKRWIDEKFDQSEEAKICTEFLDTTYIGVTQTEELSQEYMLKQWDIFAQKSGHQKSYKSHSNRRLQDEIVDFSIWLLFSRTLSSIGKGQHLLIQGYRKCSEFYSCNRQENENYSIPGVTSIYPNSYVDSMKASPWPQILAKLDGYGEKIMLDLIIRCGIFRPVANSPCNLYQTSGFPLDQACHIQSAESKQEISALVSPKQELRTPSNIRFIRNRLMYARPKLNSKGEIRLGFRHTHFFNRYPIARESSENVSRIGQNSSYILMFMFPRQFGLHNIFSSGSDSSQNIQSCYHDKIREKEIKDRYPSQNSIKIPKRLRGKPSALTERMHALHKKCSYRKLLEYYCPASTHKDANFTSMESNAKEVINKSIEHTNSLTKNATHERSLAEHATPVALVSSFCCAILDNLIPPNFWGTTELQIRNRKTFYRNVDQFLKRRRYETLSLHEALQGLQIKNIEWLGSSNNQKLCQSDYSKRLDLFHEFIYFIFDSILIPLIRTNFYVTESNLNRNQIFYFRHDVWRLITEPTLSSLKINLLKEIPPQQARKMLSSCALGYSQLRLLPKEQGFRPIMNLKGRIRKAGGRLVHGRSINSMLSPIHNVLTLEKKTRPDLLGGALFSVGDIFTKLDRFKSGLKCSEPFYFAKVDVQAAFDTIPQAAILRLISTIICEDKYTIGRHAEIKLRNHSENAAFNPAKKWVANAHFSEDIATFAEKLSSSIAQRKKNTIFVENLTHKNFDRSELLLLLSKHLRYNMVKIEDTYYQQVNGIPQGSVISTTLCNYFYADIESTVFSFLRPEESLLLRLIDDFLLITTNASHAKRFIQTMHDGLPSYGVSVNPRKTLVNFQITINKDEILRSDKLTFPYCGCLLNTKTLDILWDSAKNKNTVANSITIEYTRTPGKIFQLKLLNAFKLYTHPMFYDQVHNSLFTILQNTFNALEETALKMYAYISGLSLKKRPSTELIIQALEMLFLGAEKIICRRARGNKFKRNSNEFGGSKKVRDFQIRKGSVEWLAITAFHQVLMKKQTRFTSVITWLESRMQILYSRRGRALEKTIAQIKIH
ncbi:Bgt-2774 [Blumeria graminis f. sp. tritici]|uniref:Telomerase reverse transcriptase n=2 Tax=Blumeria graminis f. sp. tritici TaxID=62690 RepID=A0A9X9MM14_BLUGR|nr:Reverse transcriptase subunit of the telomerase holoenzyme [Blumeria graminis f. sp. tritici 96224]VDB92926.1 Bgt-2774 [Blumeria graminis f. sp. tritici]